MLRALLAVTILLGTAPAALAQLAPTPAKPRAAEDAPIDGATAAKILTQTYEQTKDATAADEFGRAIEVCERALAAEPPERIAKYARQLAAWAYNRRGEVYADQAASLFNQGEQRQATELDALALDDFQAAVRHDATKWKAIHNRGVSLALHGKVDDAVADFGRVLELKPDFVNSWFNRAEIQAQLGKWQAAIDDYGEVLKLKPDDTGAMLGRGNARFKLGQFAEAQADFDLALRTGPRSAAAYVGRADTFAARGNWVQAADDYRQAIELDAKLGRAYRGAAWLMATCPLAEVRQGDVAVQAAKKAIELDGNGDWTYLDVLAAAQANAAYFDEAQATLEKALQIAPDGAVATLQSRLALYRNRQPYRQGDPAATR